MITASGFEQASAVCAKNSVNKISWKLVMPSRNGCMRGKDASLANGIHVRVRDRSAGFASELIFDQGKGQES